MIQLTAYGERVVDRLNMMGMWLAVVVCIRNFFVCFGQYKRTRGKIHLLNLSQVTVFFIHRFLYGIIPLFEVASCAYFPLLVSLWHITYILFYVVMFMRLIILESDRHSLWIKIVGILLITVRFADWPYELAFQSIQQDIMSQEVYDGATCWAVWGNGVIILNFVGDALANLFLSGMFVRRLYLHIRMSKSVISRQNQLIAYIARKSLICLILTFVVNLAMNLLKITMFIGDRSDAFTVYFELIESTLLVEALRVDYTKIQQQTICENCGMAVNLDYNVHSSERKRSSFDVFRRNSKRLSDATAGSSSRNIVMQSMNDPHYQDNILRTIALFDNSKPQYMNENNREIMSAPAFALHEKPLTTTNSNHNIAASTTVDIPSQPATAAAATTISDRRRPLSQRPEWHNNDYRMF